MTLGQDPVISTLLYLFGVVEVRLRCSMLLLQGAQPLGRVGNDSMGSFGFHYGCRQLCESRQISRLT